MTRRLRVLLVAIGAAMSAVVASADLPSSADAATVEPAASSPAAPAPPAAELPAFQRCLRKGPRYPIRARRDGLEGRVTIGFTIDADGGISEPMLVRSEGHAEFGLSALHHFGRCRASNGATVGASMRPGRYVIPIVFRLE